VYLPPFFATLGFVIAALAGYVAYRFTLKDVNRRRKLKVANMSRQEIETERLSHTRYADRKLTFMYGL
jgi:hypothetical protein